MNEKTLTNGVPTQKLVSQLDERGYYAGPIMADASPLDDPRLYLIPGGAIDLAPPSSTAAGLLYRPAEDGTWLSIEDLRRVEMYLTRNGDVYRIGTEIDGMQYDGIGPCPDWLTLVPRPNTWSVWSGSAWVVDETLLVAATTSQRAESKMARLMHAAQTISPLQDAASLGMATEQELELLQRWKLYRIDLSRVNPADHQAVWPDQPI
ncbi:tail fiber assembly protein [Achromobacter pestifer]